MATNSTGSSVVKSVSMTQQMYAASEARSKKLKFRSYSAYVQRLIEKDVTDGGVLIINETAPPYGFSSKKIENCGKDMFGACAAAAHDGANDGKPHKTKQKRQTPSRSKKKRSDEPPATGES